MPCGSKRKCSAVVHESEANNNAFALDAANSGRGLRRDYAESPVSVLRPLHSPGDPNFATSPLETSNAVKAPQMELSVPSDWYQPKTAWIVYAAFLWTQSNLAAPWN
ncbi:Nn.00g032440.m01.CDS01 [Neocucurbitaria sp. VM-36]